mmetsp:Transcript_25821/g.44492  ORF Transcript_25821/g.44492 Transcript_25821/m.44492 type:complete len:232 (+) Transcript_25821:433-1128(+)
MLSFGPKHARMKFFDVFWCPLKRCSHLARPVRMSHRRLELSFEADRIQLPELDIWTEVTSPTWSCTVLMHSPLTTSHSLIVVSFDAVMMRLPWLLKHALVTEELWPVNVLTSCPVLTSNSLVVLSYPAVATCVSPRCTSTPYTSPSCPRSVCTAEVSPFGTSQILTVESPDAEAMNAAVGADEMSQMRDVCPPSVRTTSPLSVFHSRTVLSLEPEAMMSASVPTNATHLTF